MKQAQQMRNVFINILLINVNYNIVRNKNVICSTKSNSLIVML